ncbi:hypothetical protein TpMuguga_04g00252 [Theileria parva strain Muguga]|nr:uncharacterized protein TpMuguga_04g00252 [Theileria parva strain Muguga]EAN31604.2 hypothetical protein TpMuguga_04g00252 [Theileria parva strain Muguga]
MKFLTYSNLNNIPVFTVNSNCCHRHPTYIIFPNTNNVESSESGPTILDFNEFAAVCDSIKENLLVSEKPKQTHQEVLTITHVINTNFAPEDEHELRSQLNSLYLQLLKNNYNKPFLPDDPSFHPVNDPVYGVQNPSITGNLSYLYECIIRKRVELMIDTGRRRTLSFEDKLLLTHEIKKAPGHLICEKGKDLLIKFINNPMSSIEFEESSDLLKKHIYHFIVHYLNEKLITFSKRNNYLKDNNLKDKDIKDKDIKDKDIKDKDIEDEFELFESLISEEESLEIDKKIYQLALINMGRNLRIYEDDKFRKHFGDFNHADYHLHVENKLAEIYSFSFEQTDTKDGQLSKSAPKSVDSDDSTCISSDSDSDTDTHSDCDKPQVYDQQLPANSPNVAPVNYSPEELELRAQLDSVYHLVFKKFYDEKLMSKFFGSSPNFDDSAYSIRDLFIVRVMLEVGENFIKHKTGWTLCNISETCSTEEDKKRYTAELEKAPEDLIDQEEKKLVLKFIRKQMDVFSLEKLIFKIKARIEEIIINYLKETFLAFSRDFNLKKGKEFEFFNNLITKEENFIVDDTIYDAILEIMGNKIIGTSEDIKILQ